MKFPNFPGLEKGTSVFPNSPKLSQWVLTLPHLLTTHTFSWADTVTQLDCEMSTARDSTQPLRLLWKQDQQQDNDVNSTSPHPTPPHKPRRTARRTMSQAGQDLPSLFLTLAEHTLSLPRSPYMSQHAPSGKDSLPRSPYMSQHAPSGKCFYC